MKEILRSKKKGLNRHWKNYIDKNYLGSHNLEEGEEMLLTIAKFEGEEQVQTAEGKTPKQVLYFSEDVPKMILNITNGNTLSVLYGTHPDKWIGKQILVYAANIKAFGKMQDALRIRDFIPKMEIDLTPYLEKMAEANSLEDLKKIWATFPVSARNNTELIEKKDLYKTTLQ